MQGETEKKRKKDHNFDYRDSDIVYVQIYASKLRIRFKLLSVLHISISEEVKGQCNTELDSHDTNTGVFADILCQHLQL